MKKIASIIVISLLCVSMFSMLLIRTNATASIPWKDDFDYSNTDDLKAAGWEIEHEELASVGSGMLVLDDDGSIEARSFFRNFDSGIYDFKVETKAKWTGRTYGSLLLFVETERHNYSLHLDGYYPNYAFVRDRMEDEVRFDGYVPQFDTWLTMCIEKHGNTLVMYHNGNIIYAYIDPDIDPDALVGVGIAPGFISTNAYDYIYVSVLSSGPPEKEWNQTYGNASADIAYSLVQAVDGGFVMAGQTLSFGAGMTDFYLVKTDASGDMVWNRTYGGANEEEAYSVIQTSDGGYAIAGRTKSFGVGYSEDFWLVKTYANGTMEWSRSYGETGIEIAYSVVQTDDGGYAIGGETGAWSEERDMWLVKTDATGNMQWNKTYGLAGNIVEFCRSVVQTTDGGYALSGFRETVGGDSDAYLVKTDVDGNMQWNVTYGGTEKDYASWIIQTEDGGYAVAGHTKSFGAGNYDFWLIKTDSNGAMQWDRTYGGANDEDARCVIQTESGGYMLVGATGVLGVTDSWDAWLIGTDASGNMIWNETYGGASEDWLYSLIQTVDKGYAMAGFTKSYGAGDADFWLVKLAPFHDIAVTEVTTSKDGCLPKPTLCENYTAEIKVKVRNNGGYVESFFDVYCYVSDLLGTYEVGMQTISLNPEETADLTFAWNTNGFAKGDYTIWACAEPVTGESNTADNTYTDGTMTITMQGDINADKIVDIFDIVRVALSFSAIPTDPNWDPNANINGDGVIDIFDIVIVALHFSETSP